MTRDAAIRIATPIAADRCDITVHESDSGRHAAIRLSGCRKDVAEAVGWDLQPLLAGGKLVSDGGFVAVWFDL
jgi:DNA gyrase inhibitor GyrI